MIQRGLRHGGGFGCRQKKRTPDKMHAPRPKIPDGTHSELLLTASAQNGLGRTGRRANIGKIQRLKKILDQEFLKTSDDLCMISARLR